MIENKKVISWSLIVLFLSLSIVYSLTYQKKELLFKTETEKGSGIASQAETGIGYAIQDQTGVLGELDLPTEDVSDNGIDLGNVAEIDLSETNSINNSDSITLSVNEYSDSISLAPINTKILPGTTEYFGTLDIVSMLGKKPEIILQDSRGNFFAYYGDHLDFIQTIKTLGGNVYEMVTESEILKNQLFGDRVSYINLSTFKDIWVIMVIEIDGNVWLVQVPADKYHYSKDYLKSLFIQ